MITKDEMRTLLNVAAEHLKALNIDNDIVLETLKLMKDEAVRNGTYKAETSEGDN